MKTKLCGKLITPSGVIENGDICIENGIITYVGVHQNDNGSYEVFDYGDNYISPGFIDIHTHGAGGADFSDGTEEAFLTAAKTHLAHGTTSMLATTLTCPDEELFGIFDVYGKLCKEGRQLNLYGLHLEGPYFSVNQKGAQDERFIKIPKKEHYEKILEKGLPYIKRWSIAPELENALELGRHLCSVGVVPAIGHSDAEYCEAVAAFENGYTHLTHFYSGMSTITRKSGFRHLGLIESGYIIEDMTVEIIADGCHLPPELLKYIYKAKGADKVALVTDSLRAAGTDAKKMFIGSQENGYEVIIEDGVAKLSDRSTFAGSVATANRLVKNMLDYTDCGICDAIKMMCETPAKIMKMHDRGTLEQGKVADICIFDQDINIKDVYLKGEKVCF